MRNFISAFFALVASIIFVGPAWAQTEVPPRKTFQISNVGKPDSAETEEKLLELLALIKERDFLNAEGQVTSLMTTKARMYFIDNVVQRISPTRFVIESSPRNADGSKMKGVARKYMLETQITRAWGARTQPCMQLLVEPSGSTTYLEKNGQAVRVVLLKEVTLESLGLAELNRQSLEEKAREGHVFHIAEMTVGTDRKPVRVTWEVKL